MTGILFTIQARFYQEGNCNLKPDKNKRELKYIMTILKLEGHFDIKKLKSRLDDTAVVVLI